MPAFGESPEEIDELGDVLTLSIPDDEGGGGGPNNGAMWESFRFRLRTSIRVKSVKAFPDAERKMEEFRFAPAISSLDGKEG